MEMQINVNTKIIYMDSAVPVMRAIENVKRDIRKVCCDSDEKGCDIVLIMENMQAEQFEIKCDNNMLVIYASDTLGFVYGLYHISRDILGVLPFWFWNDQVFIKKKGCRISGEYAYTSKPYAVKYRGWFVNDEVLIHKWYVDRKKDMPWEMVFGVIILMGVWQFGSSMLIFLAALKQIPGSLYESAMVDGAKQWTMFWKITLPMLTPTIFFNLILQIVNGFRVFTESYVITDGGPLDSTLSYVLYLYRRAFTYFDMGYSCALAWILVIIIAVFTIVLFKTQNNWVHYETGGDE